MKSVFYIVFGVTLALFSNVLSYAQTLPDVESFFPDKSFGTPALSPSGRYIAMADYRGIRGKLIVVDLDNELSTVEIALPNYLIGWVGWANEDRILADVETKKEYGYTYVKDSKKFRGKKVFDLTHLLAMDRNGDDQKIMFSDLHIKVRNRNLNLAKISSFLPNDPDHILMLAHGKKFMTLWKVNIHTGHAKSVETGGRKTYAWQVDNDGFPVIRYDHTNNKRYVDIKIRAPGEQKWQELGTVKSEDIATISPIAPSGTSSFYVTARPEGHERISTFLYDLKTKTHGPPISTHDSLDVYRTLTDGNGDYFASVYFGNTVQYDFINPDYQLHIDALNIKFENKYNIWIEDISVTGNKWLLLIDNTQDPGSYYVYDTKNKHLEYLVATRAYLEEDTLGHVEIINYKARDGMALSGYLTLPPDGDKSAPLIVFPHGGPKVRDYYRYNKTAQFLATRGYQVLQPNFRGSGGFGESFAQAGYGEWGHKMQNDITDGVKHLIAEGRVSQDTICIMGMSYGGYAAMVATYDTPDLYQCAISINGVTNLPKILEQDKTTFGPYSYVYSYMKKSIGNPSRDAKKIRLASPSHHVEDINIPVLLIHGDQDDRVFVTQSRAMHKALMEASKTSEYLELKGANHNLYGLNPEAEDSEDYDYAFKQTLLAAEIFLAEHLAP